MRLLKEYDSCPGGSFIIEHYVKKEADGDTVFLRGVFTEADKKNRNGRIYPYSILEREVHKLHEQATKAHLFGALEHPKEPDPNLNETAIRILKIERSEKNPKQFIGECKILKDARDGATCQAIAKEGFKFGISTRALGSLIEKDDASYVGEDLNILTADIVADPSSQDAYLERFNEGIEYFLDPKTKMICEDVSKSLKNKLYALPKARLTEGIEDIFKVWLKETFKR